MQKINLNKFDNDLRKQFNSINILGIDECGRGSIAGPLVVAGVILKPNYNNKNIKDSKKIKSIKKRQMLAKEIIKNCLIYQIEWFEPNLVDQYNPKKTSIMGMEKIANSLFKFNELTITDYEKINTSKQQLNIIKGDQKSLSIAAASILAKSYRDFLIKDLNEKYPLYDLINNQGYKTTKHKLLIKKHGVQKGLHRLSYNLK